MIAYFKKLCLILTIRQSLVAVLIATLVSLTASYFFDKHYTQVSYLFTIPAAFLLTTSNFMLAIRAWKQRLLLLSIIGVSGVVFYFFYGIEEIGWGFWRFHIRPEWFTMWMSPFWKSIQSAAMISNFAILFWYFHDGPIEKIPQVALLSAAMTLVFGTLVSISLVALM